MINLSTFLNYVCTYFTIYFHKFNLILNIGSNPILNLLSTIKQKNNNNQMNSNTYYLLVIFKYYYLFIELCKNLENNTIFYVMYITSFFDITIIFKKNFLYYSLINFKNILIILEIFRISNKHKKNGNNEILKSHNNTIFCKKFLYKRLIYSFLKNNSFKIYSYKIISILSSKINCSNLIKIDWHNNTLLDLKAYSKIVVSLIGTPRGDGGFDL